MTEFKKIGELYEDWRRHFKSLESIASMTDVQCLIVGSDSKEKETFPTAVLGHLPELEAFYLRNFKLDFSHFGGHISEKIESLSLMNVHLLGPWMNHFNAFTRLTVPRLDDVIIDECDTAPSQASLKGLKSLWRMAVNDCQVPDSFFPTLAKYATGLQGLTVSNTKGLTPELLRVMCDRGKLDAIVLLGIGVDRDWIDAMKRCESLRSVDITNLPALRPLDLLPLANLPNLSLRWMQFEYEKESKDVLSEFKLKWNEIKKRKFGIEDEFNGY